MVRGTNTSATAAQTTASIGWSASGDERKEVVFSRQISSAPCAKYRDARCTGLHGLTQVAHGVANVDSGGGGGEGGGIISQYYGIFNWPYLTVSLNSVCFFYHIWP